MNQSSRDAEKWLELWGPHSNSIFNCSTNTFDVGCADCSDISIAVPQIDPPWILKTTFPQDEPCREGPTRVYYGGVWIYTLQKICMGLNFRCKLYEPTSAPDPSPYGDSSVLRDIAMGQAQMGIQMMLITTSRFASGNYSLIPSYIAKSYSLLIHKRHLVSDTATGSQRMIFQTFSPTSWAGLGVMLLIIFTALSLSQKMRMLKYRIKVRWRDIWFDVFMGVLNNDWPEQMTGFKRNLASSITLIVVSVLFSLVVVTLFNAMLPLKLATSPSSKLPFSTLDELLQMDYKIYGSTALRESLMESKKEVIQQLAAKMEGVSNNVDYYELVGKDAAPRAVYLAHKEGRSLLALLPTNCSCNFIEAIAHVQDYPVAPFWFKNGSQLHTDFKRLFYHLATQGIFDGSIRYFSHFVSEELVRNNKSLNCLPRPLQRETALGNRGLQLVDLSLPFICLCGVELAASVIACLEYLSVRNVCIFRSTKVTPSSS
ncbi:hypothetical protein RvY_03496 [Ramazzottius varieornatus]|uniref:Ionotropic glutamate receptor C-terminal domain-containing protein n=1 Tax=Ramazzottius varieornatus TaxID=947166 RepID=A0A1D1UN87_RAMVA|nr:hypothetical protein RvY_03496 [Ramazzottius varieornatus]